MSPRARRIGWAGGVALVLAGVSVAAAVRSLHREPPARLLEGETRERAMRLAERLCKGLVEIQTPEGEFDADPEEPDAAEPIFRTVPAAMSAAGLARARLLGVEVEGLDAALARTLDLLRRRQKGTGGSFGALPADRRNPWPTIEGISTGLMAFVWAGRTEDRDAIRAAATAYTRGAAYGLRDGRTRGIALLSVDAVFGAGHGAAYGKGLLDLVTEDPKGIERVDCGDWRVVEAMARRLRAPQAPPPYSLRILGACLEEGAPRWTGEGTDLMSWWLQSWLAARLPGGVEWFQRAFQGIEEGLGSQQRIPGGRYGDTVEESACALLVVTEGLSAQVPAP